MGTKTGYVSHTRVSTQVSTEYLYPGIYRVSLPGYLQRIYPESFRESTRVPPEYLPGYLQRYLQIIYTEACRVSTRVSPDYLPGYLPIIYPGTSRMSDRLPPEYLLAYLQRVDPRIPPEYLPWCLQSIYPDNYRASTLLNTNSHRIIRIRTQLLSRELPPLEAPPPAAAP